MNKSVNGFGEFNVVICVRFINPETLRAQNFARNDTENAELAALKQQHFLHQRKNLYSKCFYGSIHGHTVTTLNCRTCYTFKIHSSFVGQKTKHSALLFKSSKFKGCKMKILLLPIYRKTHTAGEIFRHLQKSWNFLDMLCLFYSLKSYCLSIYASLRFQGMFFTDRLYLRNYRRRSRLNSPCCVGFRKYNIQFHFTVRYLHPSTYSGQPPSEYAQSHPG